MKRYKLNLSDNPSFNSVAGLTNTSFNPNNYVENRMATEEQISQLYNRIVEQEQRRDKCCRDIIFWEAHTQIVRLNNNNFFNGYLDAGGVIVSAWDENVNVGTMRRGLKYTVTFPVKWDDNLYYPVTCERLDRSDCYINTYGGQPSLIDAHHKVVQYRYLENSDNIYGNYRCTITNNNRADFFLGSGSGNVTPSGAQRIAGYLVNSGTNWGSFTRDIKDDGTITITDNRRNTNFNIIRFYTQWTLNRCADGSLLSDKESQIFPNGRPDF